MVKLACNSFARREHPLRSMKPQADFQPILPSRAIDEVAAQIRQLIAQGHLRPGDRLPPERELSVRLQVSRNTLREALRALEHVGILVLKKGATGGAFILPGSADAVVNGFRDLYFLGAITPMELTEARVWISEIVVRVACERATEEDFAALDANIEAMARANSEEQFETRQMLNRQFHLILAHSTRNPIVSSTMEAIMAVMGEFIRRIGYRENSFTLPSRRRFMAHLRQRNFEAASREMTSFLGRLHKIYLSQWKRQGAQSLGDGTPREAAAVPRGPGDRASAKS